MIIRVSANLVNASLKVQFLLRGKAIVPHVAILPHAVLTVWRRPVWCALRISPARVAAVVEKPSSREAHIIVLQIRPLWVLVMETRRNHL